MPVQDLHQLRQPRRNVRLETLTRLGLPAVFVVGNVLSAVANSYELLMGARFLTGLPHGAFFGIGAVVG